ncbi:MAG TPA: hypothetical protein VMH27_06230 [Puia sp.]|nr:hypothetical protein [Puia sp.]
MSATLIDSVRSAFTADIVKKIAVLLGETDNGVQKGINGALPLILTDILHKSAYPDSMANIRELSQRAVTGDFFGEMHELTISPGGLLPGSVLLNRGIEYAKELLRMRYDGVVGEISRFAAIGLPSASFIAGVVSFAALDSIGRHLSTHQVESQGLAAWIKTHSDGIRATIPAGLEVKHALGIRHFPWETARTDRPRSNALITVIIVIVLVLGAGFAYNYYKEHPSAFTPKTDSTGAPGSAAGPSRDTTIRDTTVTGR